MRVGLVIYGDIETATGGYLYDRQLINFLRDHGDTVHVVSLAPRTYARALADNFSSAISRRLHDVQADVVIHDELCHPSLLRRSAYPVVALVHLLRSDERRRSRWHRVYAAVERRYLELVDAAVFNSDATRQSAERIVHRPIPGVVARPAADHLVGSTFEEIAGEFRPVFPRDATAPGGRPLRIISVANVVPGKGLMTLVDALARLPRGSWRLTVAGSVTADPAYVARVRRRIADAGVEGSVELRGEVPNNEVAELLATHVVLAVPSSYEAAGIAYLEAMRMGLAVIVTAAGGARELVDDGVEGFLVAPDDVDSLTERLERLAGDRELVARMGAAARRRADRHPTWAQSLEPVRSLLVSLVDRTREPAR